MLDMNNVQIQLHFGALVPTHIVTDKTRKTECLCLNCSKLKQCDAAKELYDFCVKYDTAMCMTRCKQFNFK